MALPVTDFVVRGASNTRQVPVLGIGAGFAAGWDGPLPEKQVTGFFRTCYSKYGIVHFDTSPYYGFGGGRQSEVALGKAIGTMLKEGVPRDDLFIATKCGRYNGGRGTVFGPLDPSKQTEEKTDTEDSDGQSVSDSWFDFSGKTVTASVETSLRLLQVEYLDLIQMHDIEFVQDVDQILDGLQALQTLVTAGKVRHIGMSGYPMGTLGGMLAHITKHNMLATKDTSLTPIRLDSILGYCHLTTQNSEQIRQLPVWIGEWRRSQSLLSDWDEKTASDSRPATIAASLTSMGLLTSHGPPDWHPASKELRAVAKQAAKLVSGFFKTCSEHSDRPVPSYQLADLQVEYAAAVVVNSRLALKAYHALWTRVLDNDRVILPFASGGGPSLLLAGPHTLEQLDNTVRLVACQHDKEDQTSLSAALRGYVESKYSLEVVDNACPHCAGAKVSLLVAVMKLFAPWFGYAWNSGPVKSTRMPERQVKK